MRFGIGAQEGVRDAHVFGSAIKTVASAQFAAAEAGESLGQLLGVN